MLRAPPSHASADVDLVFALNKPGSFFGHLDFAAAPHHPPHLEPARQFSVKALSDVELLVLEKQDLFKIEEPLLQKELARLFEDSRSKLRTLTKYAKEARRWLRKSTVGSQTLSETPALPVEKPPSSFESSEWTSSE